MGDKDIQEELMENPEEELQGLELMEKVQNHSEKKTDIRSLL
jgi:hypothetical protein